MLSFYEMNCLLEKKRRKRIKESAGDELSALAAHLKQQRAAKAGINPAPPRPAKIEEPSPDVSSRKAPVEPVAPKTQVAPSAPKTQVAPTSSEPSAPSGPVLGNDVKELIKRASATAKSKSYDVNDPSRKLYTHRSRGGVKGNSANLDGLETGMGAVGKGGGTISRQMSDVSGSDKEKAFESRLRDKLVKVNGMIRHWTTMRFLANCALAEIGMGPLKYLGSNALEKFAETPRNPESDNELLQPFAIVLKAGTGGSQQYDGQNIATNAALDVPEVEIPNKEDMLTFLKHMWDFWQRRDELEHIAPKAGDANTEKAGGSKLAGGLGRSGKKESEEERVERIIAQKKAAAAAKPKTEAQGWMDMVCLMEHWGF